MLNIRGRIFAVNTPAYIFWWVLIGSCGLKGVLYRFCDIGG